MPLPRPMVPQHFLRAGPGGRRTSGARPAECARALLLVPWTPPPELFSTGFRSPTSLRLSNTIGLAGDWRDRSGVATPLPTFYLPGLWRRPATPPAPRDATPAPLGACSTWFPGSEQSRGLPLSPASATTPRGRATGWPRACPKSWRVANGERRVCSLARALEGPLCVAGEARVDAPLSAGPRSSSQVTARTTPSGWRARNRACARNVLREPLNVQPLPAGGGPGVECGVTASALEP